MKNNLKKIILGLSVGFTVFISLFALDVIGQKGWILGLIIHLIPTYVVIFLTIISWKKEFIGGILWLITGVLVMLMTKMNLIITLPIIIIGAVNIIIGKIGLKLV